MAAIPWFSRGRLVAVAVGLSLFAGPAAPALAGKKAAVISEDTLALHPEVIALRQEVAAHPGDALLEAKLGNMYAELGWFDLAEQAYLAAVRLDDTLYEAWTNMGTIYSRENKLGPAEQVFRKAIHLQPRAALAHYNLGTVLDRAGRYDEALASYKTAVTYQPDLLDPAVNPQVVNNRHLTAIRLMSYLEEAGSGSLPLETFADKAAAKAGTDTETDAGMKEADPPAAGTGRPLAADGKPILGTLTMTIEKESRRARRQRREQSDTTAEENPPAQSL